MEYAKMKAAIDIISQCDSFTITEDDKMLIISVFGSILKSLREIGLVTTEMSAQHAVLKVSTWNNGYFCIVTRQMCSIVRPVVELYAECFD